MNTNQKNELKSIIHKSGALNKKEKYIYFDRVWHEINNLSKWANITHKYLEEQIEELNNNFNCDISNLVILSPDTVRASYGIIPVSVIVSNLLGCRFAIWKEFADIKLGTSGIYGTNQEGLTCIALQDVVRRGGTLTRMAFAVKKRKWNLALYISAIFNNEFGEKFVNNSLKEVNTILGLKPLFRFMLTIDELLT